MYKTLISIVCLFSKRARKITRLARAYSGSEKMIWKMIRKKNEYKEKTSRT